MAGKKTSITQRIIKMLEEGRSPKYIAERVGVDRQRVYSVKYMENKKKGLGALGKSTPKPTAGVGTPPKKRKYVRKNVGTGIPMPPPLIRVEPIPLPEPEPTVFEMVWRRMKNLARALGA